MESSCSSLDAVASLLSIFASLLTIGGFGLRFLHERGLHPHAHDLASELPGRRGVAGGGAGRAEGGGGEGQDDAGGHERGDAEPEPVEQGEGGGGAAGGAEGEGGEEREVRRRAEGGVRAEWGGGGGGGGGDGDFCLVILPFVFYTS
ncbi:uncharacterized protein LOC115679316 [Syzygium oleosum]|uniref:uncharacterized protein LOC115679316 n=1 Tax=Syzygium oleosum TaxID=219896 RepID=UPI0024BA03F3|nr:uncharacterized protein LOC115679316 [Syzygium oleosum]